MNTEINSQRDPKIRNYAAIAFSVIIALVGAVLMTITSSGQMKGAAMLWIPAAFQLIGGVWLGPLRGLLAGALGAYGAGIIAYGGWGLVDIILNPVAGGLANSWLPAILFHLFRIDPTFGVSEAADKKKSIFVVAGMLILVIFVGTLPLYTTIGKWSYAIANALVIVGAWVAFGKSQTKTIHLVSAAIIAVVCSAISALIGVAGTVMAGNTWEAALIGTGIGWFLGDTVSCFLGLYILAYFTVPARRAGIAR